jgi:ketosteroid isomerase-like protein
MVEIRLTKVHSKYGILTYLPISTTAQENDAAVIVMGRLRQRSTGRIVQLLIAHFIQFRDGRITELREFMDSFDAVQQVLGHEIDVSKI